MLNQPRLDHIMRLLLQHRRLRATEMARSLFVSEETIRRDFKYLEEAGKLRRIHGGAILPNPTEDQPLQVRSRIMTQAKARLAQCAASLVSEGMALFLDTGTTTLALAQHLTGFKQLKVVTNSVGIAQLLNQQSDNQVLMTPGELRRKDSGLFGVHTLEFVRQFHYDIAFMGIGAVNLESGLMDYEEAEALLRRTLVRHCRRSVILADETKFGHRTFVNSLPLGAVDTLVTHRALSEAFSTRLAQEGVEVLLPRG